MGILGIYPTEKEMKRKDGLFAIRGPYAHMEGAPAPIPKRIRPAIPRKRKRGAFQLNEMITETPSSFTSPGGSADSTIENTETDSVPPIACSPWGSPSPSTPQASMNDAWAQFCANTDSPTPAVINVCREIHFDLPGETDQMTHPKKPRQGNLAPPPILVGSGAS